MKSTHKTNGCKFAPIPVRNYSFNVCCASTADIDIPDEYELPEELRPTICDQLNTMQCVMYAACSCAESESMKRGEQKRFSPAFGYGRKECRGNYTGEGLFGTVAVNGILKIGFVPFLFFDITNIDVPDIITLANERDDLLEIGEAMKPSAYVEINSAIEDRRWNEIKRAIYVYQRPLLLLSRNYFRGGGHAVMVYGYATSNGKTKGRFLKFQNSWGKDWSVDGCSEMPLYQADEVYMFCWEELKLPFTDVNKDDWFCDEVKAAYFAELMQGKSDTEFAPNENIIRGDAALMISRLLDKFEYSVNCFVKSKLQQGKSAKDIVFAKGDNITFNDISDCDYYKDAISKVYANGIMNGISDTTFEPKAFLTRAEASAIIVRTLEMMRDILNESFSNNICTIATATKDEKFKDISKDKWYYPYVMQSVKYNLMQGNGDESFAPENNITRAEAATIFNRLFKQTDVLLNQLI